MIYLLTAKTHGGKIDRELRFETAAGAIRLRSRLINEGFVVTVEPRGIVIDRWDEFVRRRAEAAAFKFLT